MKNSISATQWETPTGSRPARRAISGLSEAFHRLFIMGNRPVLMRDLDSWREGRVSPFVASHPQGLLPLFVMAGNALWTDLGEPAFSVRVRDCARALTGIELVSVVSRTENLQSLMLAMMEAISQVAAPTGIKVNDLAPLIARAPVAERLVASVAAVRGTTASVRS